MENVQTYTAIAVFTDGNGVQDAEVVSIGQPYYHTKIALQDYDHGLGTVEFDHEALKDIIINEDKNTTYVIKRDIL